MQTLVAVYGTLKLGRGNSHYMRDAEFLGTTETPPEYTMFNLGSYPAVAKGGNTSVSLEIYKVTDPEQMDDINVLEGFRGKGNLSNFYDVEEIITKYGPATMFVMDFERVSGRPIVESGNW